MFTADNTDNYTAAELRAANATLAAWDADHPNATASERKRACERILRHIDNNQRPIYYAHDLNDPRKNEQIGCAYTAQDAEAIAQSGGLVVGEVVDTCDCNGTVTDDDQARVWLVLP